MRVRAGHAHVLGALAGLVLGWATALASDIPGVPGLPAAAEQKQTIGELPDPAALPADWFSYFAEAGGALDARASSLHKQLMAIEAMLDPGSAARALIPATLLQFERYHTLRGEASAPAIEPFTAPEHLNLIEALSLARELDVLDSEIGLARRSLERGVTQAKAIRRALEGDKVRYLGLDAANPARLETGLRIMRTRFALEADQLDGVRAQRALDAMEQRAARLQTFLDEQAAQRLQAATTVAETWGKDERALRTERAALERTTLSMPTDASAVGGSEVARAHLGLLDREARLALLDARLELIRRGLAFNQLLGDESGVEPAPLRASLSVFSDTREAWSESLIRWRDDLAHQRELARKLREGDAVSVSEAEARLHLMEAIQGTLDRFDDRLRDHALLHHLQDDWLIARQGTLDRWVAEGGQQLRGMGATLSEGMRTSLFEINETPVTMVGLLRVLLILTVIWWLSKGVRKALVRVTVNRPGVNPASVYALGKVVHYVLITIGVMISLSTLGLDISKFALLASALGVGIGFGLQNLVSNFVSGLILLFERSLKVGDFVELESGVAGEVRQINIRSTLVTTNDNVDIVIPNAEFVNGRVINWTMNEAARRVHVSFGVAYGSDKERVKQAVIEAARRVRFTLEQPGREPQVWLVKFGESSLDFELVVWLTQEGVKKPALVNATYIWEIESALTEHGIEIPFPQRDVHVRSFFGQAGDDAARVWQGSKAAE